MSESNSIAAQRGHGRYRWVLIAALFLLAAGGGLLLQSRIPKSTASPAVTNAVDSARTPIGVGCAGRVEPAGGFIVVAAAPVLGRTPVVAKLLVKEDQLLETGQTIAILDSLPYLESAVKQADARVAVAQSHVAQLQAGARSGDVAALQSDLERLQADADSAKKELDREEALARKDFIPRVQADAARVKYEDAVRLVEAARHRLESLTEVRESDLNFAKAELAAAIADRDKARLDQDAATIRSPARARVIEVRAHAGEVVGPGGVAALADTDHMDVIADVYETDVARVHPGEKAMISSETLSDPIQGVVAWISPEIQNLNVPVDPSAPAAQRVYQARIHADHPELLAHRIHSKVNVLIQP